MSLGQRLDAILRWLADRASVGLLVILGSILLVTIPSSLAAGIAATRADGLAEAVRAFGTTFARTLRQGLLPGVVAIVLAASAATSLILVGSQASGLMRGIAFTAGILTATVSILVILYAAVVLEHTAHMRWRTAAALLVLTPATAALGLALVGMLALVLTVLPIFGTLVAGLLASRLSAAVSIGERRRGHVERMQASGR